MRAAPPTSTTASRTNYVSVNADIGKVVEMLDERDHLGPLGVRGIGETGITGVAPAIGNAVFHATSIRVRRTPIIVEDILPAA